MVTRGTWTIALLLLLNGCFRQNPYFLAENDTAVHHPDSGINSQPDVRLVDTLLVDTLLKSDQVHLQDGQTCAPGSFLKCINKNTLMKCNEMGTGTETLNCSPYQCLEDPGQCAECHPNDLPFCDENEVISCSSAGLLQTSPCPVGCIGGKCVNCQVKTYFEDADGDGYGNPKVSKVACEAPVGYVESSSDCDDSDDEAYPGQTTYFDSTTDGTSKYDYNCDFQEELEFEQIASCSFIGGTCTGEGWLILPPPACGKPGFWVTCKKQMGPSIQCIQKTAWAVQKCR